jgi:2'-5' RNA ligase
MRLFTGFPVGESFTQAAAALNRANGRIGGLRWVPGVNLHVTACFIGEVSPDKLSGLKTATSEICASFKPMTLNLQEICIWPKKKPYMIWALYEEHPDFTDIRQIQLTGTSFPETILCNRLILFESRLAPEGPNYIELGEFNIFTPCPE